MRTLWPILLAALILNTLVGCNRRGADPLEWRVQGRTPIQLQNWVDETIRRMPPELGKEYTSAVITILNMTRRPNTQEPDDANDPLCLRLNKRTVREIIIEANNLEINRCRNAVSNEYTNLTRSVEQTSKFDYPAKELEKFEQRKERSQKYIKELEEQIARKIARVAELTAKN